MNSTIITIGGFAIKYYSVLILIAVFLGMEMILKEGKKFNMNQDFLFNLTFWVIILGIIGARLYYVLFNFDAYKANPIDILKIWEGGLAIHGGIIAGLLTLVLYCKKYKVNLLKILDIYAVPLILAQAIGRWGNFFNGEAHGSVTTLQHLQSLHIPNFVIYGMNINGVYYEPTFFYESAWCFIGFILLLIIRRNKYVHRGQIFATYLMWYGVGRFFVEGMRTDSLMLGSFRIAQIISVIMFIIGLIITMILSRKGKFEDLYNSDVDSKVMF